MKPSVCFVALNAYSVLSGNRNVRHIGGAEVQQVMIARGLVHCGYTVSFVVLDHGQPDDDCVDGIRVFKAYRCDAGMRFVRFFHPRLTGLWSAMKRANADIYLQRGASRDTGLVAMWARRHGRRFVFSIAHDANCDPMSKTLPRATGRFLYAQGIKSADIVLAQTEQQQRLLKRQFGLDSAIVASCCDMTSDQRQKRCDPGGRATILWVGRFSVEKRPELLIQLAQSLPQCQFEVVGGSLHSSGAASAIVDRLHDLPNATYCGYVPHEEMMNLYGRATVLLCTSESEGFPNVFLEAWSCGTPVLSMIDPDALIVRHHLGRVAKDYAELLTIAGSIPKELDRWVELGNNGLAYVSTHRSVESTVNSVEAVLQSLHT